jgi:hypothetical protein
VFGTGVPVWADRIREVAEAVTQYLRERGDGGAPDAAAVSMLACRAFTSIGERDAARRVLVFGTGLVRPAQWEVTGHEKMWVVDLRSFTVRNGGNLEMVLFGSLMIVLDATAEVWDSTGGQGVLGLRHVCATASALAGVGAEPRAVAGLADEIRDVCAMKLRQIGRGRSWHGVPRVMNLDS